MHPGPQDPCRSLDIVGAEPLRKRLQGVLTKHSNYVGLGIDEDTAVVVKGQTATVLGKANVRVCLPSTVRKLEPVLTTAEVLVMIEAVRSVYVAAALKSYLVDIAEASRHHPAIELGVSPRATLQLASAVRALAAARGRDYATPDDVQAIAPAVLAHRLLLRAGSSARTSSEDAVRELLADVPVPVAR